MQQVLICCRICSDDILQVPPPFRPNQAVEFLEIILYYRVLTSVSSLGTEK